MVDLIRCTTQNDHETVQIILQSVAQYRNKERECLSVSMYTACIYRPVSNRIKNKERMKNK
jgi:hypothetical protein